MYTTIVLVNVARRQILCQLPSLRSVQTYFRGDELHRTNFRAHKSPRMHVSLWENFQSSVHTMHVSILGGECNVSYVCTDVTVSPAHLVLIN